MEFEEWLQEQPVSATIDDFAIGVFLAAARPRPSEKTAEAEAERREEERSRNALRARSAHVPLFLEHSSEYVLGEEISIGGHGRVLEGRQVSTGRAIAVKSPNKQHIDRFHEEADLVSKFFHPNILPIIDYVWIRGENVESSRHLIMPMIRGEDWGRVIRNYHSGFDVLSLADFVENQLQVFLPVLNAVEYAHSRRVLHNDLKPSQVLLGNFGEVYLIDWGCAIEFKVWPETPPPPGQAEDELGGSCPLYPTGSPPYMAGEQARLEKELIGPWTDTYLLGAILYEIVTGNPPHAGRNLLESYRLAKQDFVHPIRPDCPVELRSIIERALSPDPAERYLSVADLREAIEEFIKRSRKRSESIELTDKLTKELSKAPGSIFHGRLLSKKSRVSNEYVIDLLSASDRISRARSLWPANPSLTKTSDLVFTNFAQRAIKVKDYNIAARLAENVSDPDTTENLKTSIEGSLQQRVRVARQRKQAIALSILLAFFLFVEGVRLWDRRNFDAEIAELLQQEVQVILQIEKILREETDYSQNSPMLSTEKADSLSSLLAEVDILSRRRAALRKD